MKVLITGCYGQVGTEFMKLAEAYNCEAIGFDRATLDITHQKSVEKIIKQHQPDAVINAAAYTAVDKAETEADIALAVNATALSHLAEACAGLSIPLVHISTDYVFDGSKQGEYAEDDAVSPLGVYGKTKLAGEKIVIDSCDLFYIFRTSWVFSAHGNNFVKTMLRLGAARDALNIVADQHGKPTSAREIAKTIYLALISNKQAWGVYHIAQPKSTTWFGFADKIFTEAKKQGINLHVSTLNAIKTEEYPTPAKRPANSVLCTKKLASTFGITIQPWQESLADVIRELKRG